MIYSFLISLILKAGGGRAGGGNVNCVGCNDPSIQFHAINV